MPMFDMTPDELSYARRARLAELRAKYPQRRGLASAQEPEPLPPTHYRTSLTLVLRFDTPAESLAAARRAVYGLLWRHEAALARALMQQMGKDGLRDISWVFTLPPPGMDDDEAAWAAAEVEYEQEGEGNEQ